MRLIAFLQYLAVVVGSVGMLAGQYFGLAKGFHLGVFVAGAGFALGGIDSLVTRRMVFRPSDDVYENYAGAPALIVGTMVLAVGAGMIGAAYLLDNDLWHSTANHLIRRPAPLFAVAGLFVIGFGVLMMLNPQGRTGWVWRVLVYFPRWLLGVLVVAAGLSAVGLGAWEWLDPQASHAFIHQAGTRLASLLPLEMLR